MPRFHEGKGSMTGKVDQISVIVPAYNSEAYLEACIESIRNQTYPNLEIIIVNDGSTDGTAGICTKLQDTFENVHIITTQDEGVSAARNAGIDAAKGDFLTFVDADDRLSPQMIRILYDCIISTGSDIAGCNFFTWRSEEEWKKAIEEKEKELPTASFTIYSPDSYVRNAILQGNSRCWSKLYRKSAVGMTRFRTGITIGEDMLFLMDLLPSVKKIAEIEYSGYGYFQNPHGAIKRKFIPSYMDQIICWELARDHQIVQMALGKDLYVQATAILMMGIMLTAGKLAMLSGAERRKQEKYVCICHNKIKEAMSVTGAYKKLSAGYKVKTKLFYYMPHLYLWLYHFKGEIKR